MFRSSAETSAMSTETIATHEVIWFSGDVFMPILYNDSSQGLFFLPCWTDANFIQAMAYVVLSEKTGNVWRMNVIAGGQATNVFESFTFSADCKKVSIAFEDPNNSLGLKDKTIPEADIAAVSSLAVNEDVTSSQDSDSGRLYCRMRRVQRFKPFFTFPEFEQALVDYGSSVTPTYSHVLRLDANNKYEDIWTVEASYTKTDEGTQVSTTSTITETITFSDDFTKVAVEIAGTNDFAAFNGFSVAETPLIIDSSGEVALACTAQKDGESPLAGTLFATINATPIARFYSSPDAGATLIETQRLDGSPITPPDPPVVAGKTFVRWGPSVSENRNNVTSLTVVHDGNEYALSRSARSFSEDGSVFQDTWTGGGTASGVTLAFTVVFTDYQGVAITLSKSSGGGSPVVLSGGALAVEGTSDSIPLTGGSQSDAVVLDTEFALASDGSSLEFFASYVSAGGGTLTYSLNLAMVNSKGETVVVLRKSYAAGTAWSAILADPDVANCVPTPSYGFWVFDGWDGLPDSGSISSDTTAFAKMTCGDFTVPVNWNGADNAASLSGESPLECTWGSLYPAIGTLPVKTGETLHGFYLFDEDGLVVCKTHDATGTPLTTASQPALGLSVVTPGSATPASGCTVKAMWKVPVSKESLEDLRAAIVPIPSAFADDGAARVEFPDSPAAAGAGAANMSTGFPSAFSTTLAQGGRVVTRQMLNEIGFLGSQEQFFEQCGGYHTFDKRICDAIGGYPESAVLRFFDENTNTLRTVMSLLDDNTWNFLTQGVDGVHWKYVDDNPQLALRVDYSEFQDIGKQLFIETGVPDLYEMPFDAYLQLHALSFVDMNTTLHQPTENVAAICGIDQSGELEYDTLNGGMFTGFTGQTFLDVYNAKTNTVNSILLRGDGSFTYQASTWDVPRGGVRYLYKQPRFVVSQGAFLLNKGDKIRVRGIYTDKLGNQSYNPTIWDARTVHPMQLTDEDVRRRYLCRYAMLYRRGWCQ